MGRITGAVNAAFREESEADECVFSAEIAAYLVFQATCPRPHDEPKGKVLSDSVIGCPMDATYFDMSNILLRFPGRLD